MRLGDLHHGFGSFVEKTERSQLHPILRVLAAQPQRPAADFVTWRGVLTRIMGTAFDHRSEWAMYGELRSGTVYIEEERLARPAALKDRLATYSGHKFEGLCMVDAQQPAGAVAPLAVRREAPVNTNAEFGIVVRARLGPHRFVLGAEVDGLDADGAGYLELKTTAAPHSAAQQRFLKEKMMKYWLQSYLAGVPRLLIGYKDRRAHVRELVQLPVSAIPRLVRGHVQWDPNAVLLMGDRFFAWLQERIQAAAADGACVFTIRHRAGGRIEFALSSGLRPDLPDWYPYY